jgi:hypothetical protein
MVERHLITVTDLSFNFYKGTKLVKSSWREPVNTSVCETQSLKHQVMIDQGFTPPRVTGCVCARVRVCACVCVCVCVSARARGRGLSGVR